MDFKGRPKLFADPEFDGDPVQIYEPEPDDRPCRRMTVMIRPPLSTRLPVPAEISLANVPTRIIREQALFIGADAGSPPSP